MREFLHIQPIFAVCRGAGYSPRTESYLSPDIGKSCQSSGLSPRADSTFITPVSRFGTSGVRSTASAIPVPHTFLADAKCIGQSSARSGGPISTLGSDISKRASSFACSPQEAPAQLPNANRGSPAVRVASLGEGNKAASPLGVLRTVGALRGRQPPARPLPLVTAG